MADDEPEGLEETTYEVGGAQVVLTRGDAHAIRQALDAYLMAHAAELGNHPHLSTGEAWIDYGGTIRMGFWLLDVEEGEWILSNRFDRSPDAAVSHRFVARIERRQDGTWRVKDLGIGRIYR